MAPVWNRNFNVTNGFFLRAHINPTGKTLRIVPDFQQARNYTNVLTHNSSFFSMRLPGHNIYVQGRGATLPTSLRAWTFRLFN